MRNTKNVLWVIVDFDHKTLIFQTVLVFGLIALFAINLGFNEPLLVWARSLLSRFFETNDVKRFALKYIVVISLSSLLLVKSLFAVIAMIKYYRAVPAD